MQATKTVRRSVAMTPQLRARLQHLIDKQDKEITEAEIIRQAIALWLEQDARARRATALWADEKGFIEALLSEEYEGGKRRWTREELYEERLSRYGRDPH